MTIDPSDPAIRAMCPPFRCPCGEQVRTIPRGRRVVGTPDDPVVEYRYPPLLVGAESGNRHDCGSPWPKMVPGVRLPKADQRHLRDPVAAEVAKMSRLLRAAFKVNNGKLDQQIEALQGAARAAAESTRHLVRQHQLRTPHGQNKPSNGTPAAVPPTPPPAEPDDAPDEAPPEPDLADLFADDNQEDSVPL